VVVVRGNKTRRTWLIRSKLRERRNAIVPMLYNNICMMLPTTDRPATASLIPYETAAPLLLDGLVVPPVEVPLGPRVVGSSVPETQVSFP